MAISLNTVNSEVVRAHKRIDDIKGLTVTDLLGEGYPQPLKGGTKIKLKDNITNYKFLLVEASSCTTYIKDNAISQLIYTPTMSFTDKLDDNYAYALSHTSIGVNGSISANYVEFTFPTSKDSIVIASNRVLHISISHVYGIN